VKIKGLLELKLFRNNDLTADLKTPLHSYTRWWVHALCLRFAYKFGENAGLWFRDENGDYYGPNYLVYLSYDTYPSKVAVGASNQAYSYDDYKLIVKKDETTTINLIERPTATNGGAEMEFEGIVNVTSEYNLWEAGLFSSLWASGWVQKYYLVARDVLPNPIRVHAGDKVHLRYKIIVG
jgi:hypothetical protein